MIAERVPAPWLDWDPCLGKALRKLAPLSKAERLTVLAPEFVVRGLEQRGDLSGADWIPYPRLPGALPEPACVLVYMAELHELPESFVWSLRKGWKLVYGNSGYALFYRGGRPLRPCDADHLAMRNMIFYLYSLRRIDAAGGVYRSRWGQSFQCGRSTSNLAAVEEPINAYFRNLPKLEEGAVVVDVGAHIGAFSVPMARLASGARVFAYEPDPSSRALLEENLRLNGLANVFPRPEALSAAPGRAPLFRARANPVLSNLLGPVDVDQALDVPVLGLPDVLARESLDRIDLLKIDAPGSEYDILFPHPELVRTRVESLIVEAHSTERGTPAKLGDFLRRLGYAVRLDGHSRMAVVLAHRRGRKGVASPPPKLGWRRDWVFRQF
jgi:FkbM family methyltransferase